MPAFFSTQLDFIFFFYGLAFILLGAICLGIARGGRQETPWVVLGLFAFVHGASEWLDLSALIVGDTPVFAVFRTGVMIVSFMILVEFARREGMRIGLKCPGSWVYLPLLLLVLFGAYDGGLNGANALARYAFGFTGAGATAFVLAFHARGATRAEKRWLAVAIFGFALYAIAAGLIVPPARGWEGDFFNYGDFTRRAGSIRPRNSGLLDGLRNLGLLGPAPDQGRCVGPLYELHASAIRLDIGGDGDNSRVRLGPHRISWRHLQTKRAGRGAWRP